MVFRKWTFFTKCGHESSDLFVKNGKKGVLLTFLPVIKCSFDRMDALLI